MFAPTRILVAIHEEFQSNKPDGLGILSEFYKIKLSSASLRKFRTENLVIFQHFGQNFVSSKAGGSRILLTKITSLRLCLKLVMISKHMLFKQKFGLNKKWTKHFTVQSCR